MTSNVKFKRIKRIKKKRKSKLFFLFRYTFSTSSGFYHNPDSINLTLNQSQIQSMYNYSSTNNSFLANIPNQLMQTENINNSGQINNKINNINPNINIPNNNNAKLQSKFA